MANQDNAGFLNQSESSGEYNQLLFIVEQAISKINTMALVKVVGVSGGAVDVVILVNQIDSNGNPSPHATIFNVPFIRFQAAGYALIIDPEVGDIGLCGFCSRDISKVKKSKKQDNPGSRRRYSYSDGIYIGAIGNLNINPTQWVKISSSGIELKSTTEIKIEAPTVTITGDLNQSGGNVEFGGDVEFGGGATKGGIDLAKIDHTHAVSGASTGPGLPGGSGP